MGNRTYPLSFHSLSSLVFYSFHSSHFVSLISFPSLAHSEHSLPPPSLTSTRIMLDISHPQSPRAHLRLQAQLRLEQQRQHAFDASAVAGAGSPCSSSSTPTPTATPSATATGTPTPKQSDFNFNFTPGPANAPTTASRRDYFSRPTPPQSPRHPSPQSPMNVCSPSPTTSSPSRHLGGSLVTPAPKPSPLLTLPSELIAHTFLLTLPSTVPT